ncbi:hypothetical protein FVE67_05580 [Thermosulfurimonas marina]|uniref:Uncharacterized protein n=1 Tax=Thermosulfurimonas marina TaxID=2047767 RepID=A0A6H1WT01_9BACT|nr:hypothetical protein [Thermosulfurimonas marina]QJA06308.1 hypothetical protein FVE67_05580 [Thermosulfurimonas marina]
MRVPKRYLPFVAGGLWLAVGLGLAVRGLLWWRPWHSPGAELALVALLPVAFLFASRVLFRVARRNLAYIATLPERVTFWAFQPRRSWLLMGGMILLGITLRRSPLPRDLLGVLYFLMGTALILTGPRFWLSGL